MWLLCSTDLCDYINMTYSSVWWYPNYTEYGCGLNTPRSFTRVYEQYRRPHALYDLRYYDLPTDKYQEKLYYRLPRLGLPEYRGTFRDKPHTLTSYYPSGCPEGKPAGFHGRMYYEDGPPQFKYDGPKKDELYWLERNPYLPQMPDAHPLVKKHLESHRGLNPPTRCTVNSGCCKQVIGSRTDVDGLTLSRHGNEPEQRFVRIHSGQDYSKRVTFDGVGYL